MQTMLHWNLAGVLFLRIQLTLQKYVCSFQDGSSVIKIRQSKTTLLCRFVVVSDVSNALRLKTSLQWPYAERAARTRGYDRDCTHILHACYHITPIRHCRHMPCDSLDRCTTNTPPRPRIRQLKEEARSTTACLSGGEAEGRWKERAMERTFEWCVLT